MKKEHFTIQMDAEKLRALKRYMSKKEVDLERELCEQLERLYEKFVPSNVRDYINEGDEDNTAGPVLPRKAARKRQEEADVAMLDENS